MRVLVCLALMMTYPAIPAELVACEALNSAIPVDLVAS
jgi:hypothetical protein